MEPPPALRALRLCPRRRRPTPATRLQEALAPAQSSATRVTASSSADRMDPTARLTVHSGHAAPDADRKQRLRKFLARLPAFRTSFRSRATLESGLPSAAPPVTEFRGSDVNVEWTAPTTHRPHCVAGRESPGVHRSLAEPSALRREAPNADRLPDRFDRRTAQGSFAAIREYLTEVAKNRNSRRPFRDHIDAKLSSRVV